MKRQHSKLNCNHREKEAKLNDPLGGIEDEELELQSPESVQLEVLRKCHQELLRQAQSQLAEIFVEYEEQLMGLLQNAMTAVCDKTAAQKIGELFEEIIDPEAKKIADEVNAEIAAEEALTQQARGAVPPQTASPPKVVAPLVVPEWQPCVPSLPQAALTVSAEALPTPPAQPTLQPKPPEAPVEQPAPQVYAAVTAETLEEATSSSTAENAPTVPAGAISSLVVANPSGEAAAQTGKKAKAKDGHQKSLDNLDADLREDLGTHLAFDPAQAAQDALDSLDEDIYRVENFYKKHGIAQALARSIWFQEMTLGIISVNAVYLGVDADWNKSDLLVEADWHWILFENLFCVFFTGEILVRFGAFERKLDCLHDGWFKFDSFLVILMIFEIWGMMLANELGAELSGIPTAPLRLLRLLRLSRMVRLMRSMPELVTMIKGIRTASRAVASSVVMVLLLVYVFAIILNMVCEPLINHGLDAHGEVRVDADGVTDRNTLFLKSSFQGIGLCMWTLLMDGSLMFNAGEVLLRLRLTEEPGGYLAVLVFLGFTGLSALTVLNMLIGVLCEVVTSVGQQERDEADIRLVKHGILKELIKFDVDGSGTISQSELEAAMKCRRAQAVLQEMEVDRSALDEMHGMLFKETDEVGIKVILETCLQYRGSQPPTVKHLVDSMVFSRHHMEQIVMNATKDLMRTFIRQNTALTRRFSHALEDAEDGSQARMLAASRGGPGLRGAADLGGKGVQDRSASSAGQSMHGLPDGDPSVVPTAEEASPPGAAPEGSGVVDATRLGSI